ncbi:MAG: pectate lyase family protein [Nocardioidaceae bacterium]
MGRIGQRARLGAVVALTAGLSAAAAAATLIGGGSELKAFPGAEGFGADTAGGRGGRVIEVTNLDDSGPGSFRAAVEASGPRIVVFRVAGTITLQTRITVDQPFLTIAGQSAPGEGITLRSAPSNPKGTMYITTHDVVLRYLRLRPGTPNTKTDSHDALTVWNDEDRDLGAFNVVVDHCSFSWAVDENLATYHNARDITFSWNIVSESLSYSEHPQGEHSKGFHLSGDGSGNITAHHNLLAHNEDRNPQPTNPGVLDFRNNVVYNYGEHAMVVSDSKGKPSVNVVGNYYRPGPDSSDDAYPLAKYDGSGDGHGYYVAANVGSHDGDEVRSSREFVAPDSRDAMVRSAFDAPAVTTTTAEEAYDAVLAGAGASRDRDAVDNRVVRDVRDGGGQIIDHESEVGGWPHLRSGTPPADGDHDGMPDAWEAARGLDPGVDDSAKDRDGDGYTNVEEYLNGL